MKIVTVAAAISGLVLASVGPVEAKGCIKGAIVGGLAGHMAGHGVLGAAGGCAVGRYRANRNQDRRDNPVRQPTRSDPGRL